MLKIKASLVLFFATSFALNAAESADINTVHSWMPERIATAPELVRKINLRQNEKERLTQVRNGSIVMSDSDLFSYGTNTANLGKLRVALLNQIRAKYESTGRRPRVLEIGPGHGFFAETLLIAGADLTVVELQENALAIATGHIKRHIPPFLAASESIDDVYHPIKGDITNGSIVSQLSEHFDFVVAFNVVHFFTPDRFEFFLNIVQHNIVDGGKFFMIASTPASLSQWIFYKAGLKNSKPYPGFMAYEENSYKNNSYRCEEPGSRLPGYCSSFIGDPEIHVHNFFMPETLHARLTEHKFTLETCVYRDDNDNYFEKDVTVKYDYKYSICIEARK